MGSQISSVAAAERDRDALVALYIATDGPRWERKRNWNKRDEDIATWEGVTVNAQGRVVGLSLCANNLRGMTS
ncbi:unnamed protein product, partial [Hapterophycus canaliculatus]